MEYWSVRCELCSAVIPLKLADYHDDGQPQGISYPIRPIVAKCLKCHQEKEYEPDSPLIRDADSVPIDFRTRPLFR